MMSIRKVLKILIVSFVFIGLIIISDNNISKGTNVIQDLKKKSDLDTTALHNISSVYSGERRYVNQKNKINSSQLLQNDLIFDGIEIKEWDKNTLKVEMENSNLANKFKGKSVDIFGEHYGAYCVGEIEKKTACMYGGLTLHEENSSQKKVGVNVFKDGHQQKGLIIDTDKNEPTVQELDLKTRSQINKNYDIYNSHTENIQKGYITFHSDSFEITYDLFNFKGKTRSEFLKFYSNNETIKSKNLHIDVYLFEK